MGKEILYIGMGLRKKDLQGTCKCFERMGIAGLVYKGLTPSKITNRADSNHVSNDRKRKVG